MIFYLFLLVVMKFLLLINCKTILQRTSRQITKSSQTNIIRKISTTQAPVAKKVEYYHKYHDKKFKDEYQWLRNDKRENVEVLDYLKEENKYAEEIFKDIKPLSDKIYEEMVSRIAEDDISVPIKKGDYLYYTREIKGKQYSMRCRKYKEEEEQVLLDLNEFKDKYLRLGAFKETNTNDKVAYTLDTTGDEKYFLFIKDFKTNETKEELKDIEYNFIWSNCNKYIYYTVMDSILRPYKLLRHKVGTPQSEDVELLVEKDEQFLLGLSKSTNEKYLLVNIASSTSSEVHYVDLDKPLENIKLFSKRQKDRLYSLDAQQDKFLVLTNRFKDEKFINFVLLKADIDNYQNEEEWDKVIEYEKDVFLTEVHAIKDFILLDERYEGLTQIRVIDNEGKQYRIEFEEPIFEVGIESLHLDYNSSHILFSYSSLTTPKSYFEFHVADKQRQLVKQQQVLGDFDKDEYVSERIITKNHVPISIVYKKDMIKKDGNNPLHLYGYGSYGYSTEPSFKSNIISLLDRGFIFAIAHIRGGSELGRHWYELEGKLLNKKNTFTDFAECAKTLIEYNYTSPSVLSMEGRSAGGLLMGAVLNENYELFNAVIAGVPFVDVINTMMDASIPLTINEYEEWGNPNNKEYFDYMLGYSPYDNLPNNPKHFPHVLVRSGLYDPRVQYWEPAKYVAKLRTILNQSQPKPISSKDDKGRQASKLIHLVNMGAGHFGSSGKYDYLKELALDYAFLVATAKRLVPFN